jgi:hypothetical protein
MQVNFTKVSGSGTKVKPPASVVDLKNLTGFPLSRDQIGDSPSVAVYTQIRLPGASKELKSADKKGKWIFKDKAGEKERELTHQVFWERELAGRSINMEFRFLGSASWTPVTLTSPSGEDIFIEIFHLPSELDDHKLKKGEPALHFEAYYDLYTRTVNRYIPFLNESPGKAWTQRNGESLAGSPWAANTFTCMTSQVPLG